MTTTEIKIKIRNQNKAYFDVSYCLPDDEQLLGAIRDVRENVSTFVRNQLPDVFTSIAYHMRGPKRSTNPHKPTVLFFCKPESRHIFEFVEKAIAEALHSSQHPQVSLHVELLPGIIELMCPLPSPKSGSRLVIHWELPAPVNNSSIGVRRNQEDAGTLGGWVTFQRGDRQPMKCILTCYHVIQNGDLRNRHLNDTSGIGFDEQQLSTQIEVLYPSPLDINAIRNSLLDAI
jgi:hypothetical protein